MGDHVAARNADDYRAIAEAIIEMSAARRKISLYPKDHPKILEILLKSHEALQKGIHLHGPFTVGIAEGGVVVEDVRLDSRNPAIKDFARTFQERGIAAVTFTEGISGVELMLYHELLSSRESPVGEQLAVLAAERGLSHIIFLPIDMGVFSFSGDALRDDEKNESLWDEYMRVLLEDNLGDSGIMDKIAELPPAEIAKFINSLSDAMALERSLEGLVRQFSLSRRKRRQLNELFMKFIQLLENLTPQNRERFLKQTVASDFLDLADIHEHSGELTPELLESMVRIFEEQSRVVPENSRQLVEKLNDIADSDPVYYEIPLRDTAVIDDMELDSKTMRVFDEDPTGRYVDSSYQAMLQRVRNSSCTEETNIASEVERECNSGYIDAVSTDIMFELLNVQSATREEYLSILNRLGDFIGSYIDTGRFQDIALLFRKIQADAVSGIFAAEAAAMKQSIFGSSVFLGSLIEAMKVWGRHDRERVYELVEALKEYLVEPLLDALAQESDIGVRRFLLDVMGRLGDDLLPGAAERLCDERWYVVRNMIYLIRECEGVSHLHHIRLLTKHADRRVALEAAKTLLHFRTADAASCLRQFMVGRDLFLREHAVRLAGTYKVRELVPVLSEMLEKREFGGAMAELNVTLVRALAETADPRAVEAFVRVYKASSFLHRAALEALKTEIFRHLHLFSPEVIRPLADLGASSKNGEIRNAAERLRTRGRGNG